MQVFRSLKANLFSSTRVGLGSKLKFYKSLVLPRLMYGAAERHRVRWLGHAACKPNDVMVKQLFFAHSIPGHHRPMGRPHLTWMDTAMHEMGSLGRTLQIDLLRD